MLRWRLEGSPDAIDLYLSAGAGAGGRHAGASPAGVLSSPGGWMALRSALSSGTAERVPAAPDLGAGDALGNGPGAVRRVPRGPGVGRKTVTGNGMVITAA